MVGDLGVVDPVVALFNWRWGGKTVRLIVEQIYATFEYSISEKVAVARSKKNRLPNVANPEPQENPAKKARKKTSGR